MNTPDGRQKAKETNLKKDPDYYKNLGSMNKGKAKSKPTGFQLISEEEHRALSSKGGKSKYDNKGDET